jgi:hypothetical protein
VNVFRACFAIFVCGLFYGPDDDDDDDDDGNRNMVPLDQLRHHNFTDSVGKYSGQKGVHVSKNRADS